PLRSAPSPRRLGALACGEPRPARGRDRPDRDNGRSRAAAHRPALGGLELTVLAPLGPNGGVPALTGRSAPTSSGQPDPAAARPALLAAAGPHPGARVPRRLP